MSFCDALESIFIMLCCRPTKEGRGECAPRPFFCFSIPQLDLALQEKRDHEAVEGQRLDKGETENQRQKDFIRGVGIAADALHCRGAHASLAQGSAEGGNAYSQTSPNSNRPPGRRIRRGCPGCLSCHGQRGLKPRQRERCCR